MTDKQFSKQRERVLKIFNSWRDLLNLNAHRFNIEYYRSYSDDVDTVASINSNWQYKNHHITFFMPKVASIDDDSQLEESIVHELVHVMIDPISSLLPDDKSTNKINEFVTTSVAFALIWARDHKKET